VLQEAFLKDQPTDVLVNSRERVIEEDNVGIIVDGSSKGDSLTLSTGKVDTTLRNFGLVTGNQEG